MVHLDGANNDGGARSRSTMTRSHWLQSLAVVLLVGVASGGGCAQSGLTPGEGFAAVPGGKVWYRIYGSGDRTPLLMLHGGPGGRSCAFSVLAELAADRPLVIYDQLGSGRSERPTDTSLWQTQRFVAELAALRDALGLTRIHLLGHSWGGTLATEYLLTMKPTGVESVILSSPLISTPRWIADANRLRSTLPQPVQEELDRCETVSTVNEPSCQAATDLFYERFVRGAKTLPAIPDCEGVTANDVIYQQMWGAAEFTATGSLRDYDRSGQLGELRLPVLFVAGRNDEAAPETLTGFQRSIPGARLAVLEHSAHASYRTETAEYVRIVREFLNEVDGAGARR
jgi:proline iminopeptidase